MLKDIVQTLVESLLVATFQSRPAQRRRGGTAQSEAPQRHGCIGPART